jgi:DNA-binding transcriptional ArsR family regulator
MKGNNMEIEDVFSSKLRIKILKTLLQIGEMNVTKIARRLHINYGVTVKHLKILEEEGILRHKLFGRIRLYRFNENSLKAKAIQRFINSWECIKKEEENKFA